MDDIKKSALSGKDGVHVESLDEMPDYFHDEDQALNQYLDNEQLEPVSNQDMDKQGKERQGANEVESNLVTTDNTTQPDPSSIPVAQEADHSEPEKLIPQKPTLEQLKQRVRELAELDRSEYEYIREDEACNLYLGVTRLDDAVNETRRCIAKEVKKEEKQKAIRTRTRNSAKMDLSPSKISKKGFVSYVEFCIDFEARLIKLVDLFNKHHAIVIIGGKTRVMKINIVNGSLDYEFIAPKEFVQLYRGYMILAGITKTGREVYKDYATAWLEHPLHKIYGDGVVFEPNNQVLETEYNRWQGFSVKPTQSNIELWYSIKIHIEEIICDGDPELIKYFYDWVAYTFQCPEKPAGTAIVIRGLKGTGKGTIAKFLLKIWGYHGKAIQKSCHLTGKFNAHLADTCFLFADEAFFSGDKEGEGVLKGLITESDIMIERKGIDPIQQPNFLKIMMATNKDWAVPATRDERRYCVLDISDEKRGDRDYFNALHIDINNKDVQSAFLYDMLNRDISEYHSGNIPESKGLQDQRMHSLSSAGKWLLDSLNSGYLYDSTANKEWLEEVKSAELYDSYIKWCNDHKTDSFGIKSQTLFGRYLKDIGFIVKKSNGIKSRIFGTLEEAIRKFETYEKILIDRDS